MDFIKTLLAKSRGSEPDDTLIHLECPVQMPLGSPFRVEGWIVSRFEIREVRTLSTPEEKLQLVERPDVAAAYPRYRYAKGFTGTLSKDRLDGDSLSLQCRLGEHLVSYKRVMAINPLPSVRKQEKLKKLHRILPHLICLRCGSSFEGARFPYERTDLVCTRCNSSYPYNKSSFNFLSEELRGRFEISETDNVSSHEYCPVALSLIAKSDEGLVLDCGAGLRSHEYPNVINFEVADFPSTDVIGVNERLPFRDGTFDAVFSLSVLEHVKDPFLSSKEISRVLKKGGILYCVVPFLQPLHSYPNHFYNMTSQGLVSLFEQDMEILERGVPSSGLPVSTLTWFLRSWADGLTDQVRRDFLDMRVSDLIGHPEEYLEREFVTGLTEAKNFELAGTTAVIGKKRLASSLRIAFPRSETSAGNQRSLQSLQPWEHQRNHRCAVPQLLH